MKHNKFNSVVGLFGIILITALLTVHMLFLVALSPMVSSSYIRGTITQVERLSEDRYSICYTYLPMAEYDMIASDSTIINIPVQDQDVIFVSRDNPKNIFHIRQATGLFLACVIGDIMTLILGIKILIRRSIQKKKKRYEKVNT